MLAVSVILLLLGALAQKEYQGGIDWPILLFLGSILVWPQVMKTTGMDDLISLVILHPWLTSQRLVDEPAPIVSQW